MEMTYDGELLTDGRFPVRAKHRFTYLDFLGCGPLHSTLRSVWRYNYTLWRSSAVAQYLSLAQMRFRGTWA